MNKKQKKLVFVINKDGKPLDPCECVIARLLLKQKKAKCIRKTPFTIKLLYETTNYTQDVTHGLDSGSGTIGSSAVTTKSGDVLYMSEIEIRNDITKKMERRKEYRRARRQKKTRYRQPRYLNRKNSKKKDRFSPTMTSKIDAHIKEINFVKSILPITKIRIEGCTFDVHALKNPEVLKNKELYSKGANYGLANSKAFALVRDDYQCQECKAKQTGIEAHHIIYRCHGGSDEAENLICLCKKCHDEVHANKLVLKKNGKKKDEQLKHATQMNSIRKQLFKRVPEAIETFGFITKEHRYLMGLPKTHYFDAVAIASYGNEVNFRTNVVLYKKCVASGDYKRTMGVRSQITMPKGKIGGFKTFDKVEYLGNEYFIKARRITGYFELMDIHGNKIDFSYLGKGMKTPKMKNMTRISARKSWIMQEEILDFNNYQK